MKRIKILAIASMLVLLCSLSFIACQTKVVVTLDPNGGSGGTTVVYPVYGDLMPEAEAPVRPGYTFEGYFDAKVGGLWYYGENMQPKRTWRGDEDLVLYAQWTAIKYGVTLDKCGGTGGTATLTATMGQPLTTVEGPTRAGYVFMGYFDSPEGGEMYYDEIMNGVKAWDKAEASKLYAQWDVIPYEVKLEREGGEGGTTSIEAKIHHAMPEATAPTKQGNTFVGYYTMPSGRGIKYYDANMSSVAYWPKAEEGTLYAYYAPFTVGKGLADDPFIIASKDDFDTMRGHEGELKDIYFALDSDIDYNGEEWVPVGTGVTTDGITDTFAGHFDGRNHTISNYKLTVTRPYSGIFGLMKGNLSNLKVKDFTITAKSAYSGGLAGNIHGFVDNCSATNGTMTLSGVGGGTHGMLIGMIGYLENPSAMAYREYGISNSYAVSENGEFPISITSPSGQSCVGGLVGTNSYSTVTNCYAKVNISVLGGGAYANIGGLIGYNDECSIYTSYATGKIYGTSSSGISAGGLVGYLHNYWYIDETVENCYTTGSIELVTNGAGLGGSTKVGGLIAYAFNGLIKNCYTTGNVSATDTNATTMMVGGLTGDIYRNTFANCFVTGDVYASYGAGSTFYGRIFANNDANATNYTNVHYYESQKLTVNRNGSGGGIVRPNNQGEKCTAANLNSASFYTTTLKWSADIWELSDLAFASGKLAKLKA